MSSSSAMSFSSVTLTGMIIPGMSGLLGKGTASTCGCELGCAALTMIPPLVVDDDDADVVLPPSPALANVSFPLAVVARTNAFFDDPRARPTPSAATAPAPSSSNSALDRVDRARLGAASVVTACLRRINALASMCARSIPRPTVGSNESNE